MTFRLNILILLLLSIKLIVSANVGRSVEETYKSMLLSNLNRTSNNNFNSKEKSIKYVINDQSKLIMNKNDSKVVDEKRKNNNSNNNKFLSQRITSTTTTTKKNVKPAIQSSSINNIDTSFDPEKFVKNVKKPKFTPKSHQNDKTVHRGVNQIRSIYNNLKDGNLIFGDKEINTVRYVPSIRMETKNKVQFMFNLSSIKYSEKLIKPELYINKRYVRNKMTFNLHYMLYTASSNRKNNSQNLNNHENHPNGGISTIIDLTYVRNERSGNNLKKNGWHMFNIFDSLNSYLNVRNNKQKMARLKNENQKGVYYTFDDANLMDDKNNEEIVLIMEAYKNGRSNNFNQFNDAINPYLIIYTSEDETQMKKFFQNRLPDELKIDEDENKLILAKSMLDVNDEELKSLKNFEDHVDDQNEKIIDLSELNTEDEDINKIKKTNLKDVKETNENLLPNDLSHYTEFNTQKSDIFKTSETKNKNKSASIYYNYNPKSDQNSPIMTGILDKTKSNYQELEFIIDDLKPMVNKKKSRRHLNDYDLKSSSFELDGFYNPDDELYTDSRSMSSEDHNAKCDTKPILIDFEDLSFSSWILEPKRYLSNYCSGGCKLPFNKVC